MATISITDMCGNLITLPNYPQRIVSVVPSQTELLYDLGLNETVIGITKFCVHPKQWFENKTRIGGTKNLNLEKIISLQPDLIIANKEENTKSDIELLAKYCPVYISDIFNLQDNNTMIVDMGTLTNTQEKAAIIINKINTSFENLPKKELATALYLIWKKPYMAAGKNTFIDAMLPYAGFKNCLQETRYPSLDVAKIIQLQPQNILLSSEPFPFKQQHIDELQVHLPNCKIQIVDGEMFSWYGSRMLLAADYFKKILTTTLILPSS
jgi:ABC-type Fe3+-hydroxamate transport system substrate-binding protein